MSAHWNYTSHLLVHLSLETLSPPLLQHLKDGPGHVDAVDNLILLDVYFYSKMDMLQAPPRSGSGYIVCSHGASCQGSDLPRALKHFACLLEDRVSYLSFNFLFSIYPFTLHFQTTAVSETKLKN